MISLGKLGKLKILLILLYVFCIISDYNVSCSRRKNERKGRGQQVSTRIVNGTIVKPNELPYQLAMFYDKKLVCGASLVSNIYAITAAHCVQFLPHNLKPLKLVAGEHHITTNEGKEVDIPIGKLILHPEYNEETNENDIALIKFKKPLQFNSFIQPIQLAPPKYKLSGKVQASGWGHQREDGTYSHLLRSVTLPIVDEEKCESLYEKINVTITSKMLCAGKEKGGKGFCQIDTGGPLIHVLNTVKTLVGIISFGEGCARADFPGVYTKVRSYRDWIDKNMAT